MSTFWIVYWATVAIMTIATSTSIWWAVTKEGEDLTLQALIIALAITFIPIANVIVLVLGTMYLFDHNIKLVLIRGRK